MVLMEKQAFIVRFMLLFLLFIGTSEQKHSSQFHTLLRVKQLLNSPPSLSSWNRKTNFCSIEPTSAFTVVCYEGNITQLHIVGENGSAKLPGNFSIDSFVTTLSRLTSLKVLKLVSLGLWGYLPSKIARFSGLEILNLTSNYIEGEIPQSMYTLKDLQTLILDDNKFTGVLPEGLGSLSLLTVLSVKNNSLSGSLPQSLGTLENLRIVALCNNNFSGEVPDLGFLANLQVLNLENNLLGPHFPVVRNKIERIVLRKNKFSFGIPVNVTSYYLLKALDISSNRFLGPLPMSLISLPSLIYLDISDNRFTGLLQQNLQCNAELEFVNISSNMLTGKLPQCLVSDSRKRVFRYAENCLEVSDGDEHQQPVSSCRNEALAVGILPRPRKRTSKTPLFLSVTIGIIGGIVLAVAGYFTVKNILLKREAGTSVPRFDGQKKFKGYTPKFLQDARSVTESKKLGTLGLPSYKTFTQEEIKDAVENTSRSTLLEEGSHHHQVQLRDGSSVAIRCFEFKRNRSTQHFRPHIEMISKLRHHHLVTALGHCFEYHSDESHVSRMHLVFEFISNGTLRSWTSEKRFGRNLTWPQRIAAVTGVAKGVQFLHAGIVPGLFSNNIKITDVLLDQNLVAKINSCNLPWISESIQKLDHKRNFMSGSKDSANSRMKHQDKMDIYNIGVILIEVISGKPVNSRNEVELLQDEFQAAMASEEASRWSVVDPMVSIGCSNESAKTMIDICLRCLLVDPAERPSIEDVLWNLQFAAQVQGAWRGDSQSNGSSPISPIQ